MKEKPLGINMHFCLKKIDKLFMLQPHFLWD